MSRGVDAVRPAAAQDVPAMAAILAGHALWRHQPEETWRRRLEEMLADGHEAFVHTDGEGRVDAFALVSDRTFGDCGYLRLIGVRPGATGTGIGGALLARVEGHFARRGRRALVLMCTESNAGARRFYERAGYRAVGALPGWVREGETERLYVKELGPPASAVSPAAPAGLAAAAAASDQVWSTERPNPRTLDLDRRPTREVVQALHAEDHEAVRAVDGVLDQVARAADLAAEVYAAGGRWVFVGAGTSGRLAFAEAAECPPTFGTPPERIVAVMAGGTRALWQAAEGAEDDEAAAARDLAALGLGPEDLVVAMAASGRTPYVLGAVRYARQHGARTVAITAVPDSPLCREVDIAIAPDTGPEAVLGSTRLKAGTAQKLVANMLTTAAMVRLGRVYGNLMVNLQTTNQKLRARAERLVALAAGVPLEAARRALDAAGGDVKVAIAHLAAGLDVAEAARRLAEGGGDLRAVLARIRQEEGGA
jgi:N-acetylmuramic acid 6-phosphate etherase